LPRILDCCLAVVIALSSASVALAQGASWKNDMCPPQVSNAFRGCTTVAVMMPDNTVAVCGCRDNVTKCTDANPSNCLGAGEKVTLKPLYLSITKEKLANAPDPCQTWRINGVPTTYCW